MSEKSPYGDINPDMEIFENQVALFQKLEKQLKECETRFQWLYEKNPLGYHALDETGFLIEVNQTWLNHLGYQREEVIGKYFGDFLHPDWINHFKENFPRFKSIGEIQGVEFEMIKKDGSILPVSFNGKIEKDANGNFKQTHCILYDITRKKLTEEALKREKDRAQKYLDIAGVIMIVLNADQTVAMINKKGTEILGYSIRDIVDKNWFDQFIPDSDRETTRQSFMDLIAGHIQTAEYFENYVIAKRGEKRLIAWHNSILTDKKGKITRTLSSGEDITERRQVKEELKQIFDMSLDFVCIADINSAKFTKINPSFTRTLGYSEEELLGRTFFDFIHPDDIEPTKQVLKEKLRKGHKVIRFENRYRCKDGKYRWLSWNSHPNPEKGFTCAVGRDITDQKKEEQKRRKLELQL